MKKIQVDAFEVQLGAGMLLQFRDGENQPVTILADAGVHASGYDNDRVLLRLPGALDAFYPGNRRIDLIVGTHYDADHLCGLPPIIRDKSIEIGEIWLPPVADDEAPTPKGASLREGQYLAMKWLEGDGEKLAKDYLQAKWSQCEELRALEREALGFAVEQDGLSWKFALRRRRAMLETEDRIGFVQDRDFATIRTSFQAHLGECGDLPGDESCECHADTDIEVDAPLDEFSQLSQHRLAEWCLWEGSHGLKHLLRQNPLRSASASLSFAHLRRSTAVGAITASHLAEVVAAIRERGNIPTQCRVIPNGTPVKLKWSRRHGKFLPGAAAKDHEPIITLLGPSASLVEKHRDRLPIVETAKMALLSSIPIKSITPSNQLSYIFRIDHEGQGLLVTGDAGCVDYKMKAGGAYYPSLVEKLSGLHLIQVAHHAGNNAHFYRVLLEPGVIYPEEGVFLILSHKTEDAKRPSEAFGEFIGSLPPRAQPSLLFTSRPRRKRVEGFEDLIHSAVGPVGDVGDVKISFDGREWQVDAHAVIV